MMYLPSVIGLLFLFLHYIDANIKNSTEPCNGNYCVPKHLCPYGNVEGGKSLEQNDLITLLVDEDSECGDFMKICCTGSSMNNNISTPTNDAVPIADDTCGISNPQGLVYNVESNFTYAKYAEFPWTVAIFRISFSSNDLDLTYVGGGTLIHPKFILTAAHILEKPHRYVARFGEWNLMSEAEIYPAQEIGIEELILHPSYRDLGTPENDIALAVLKQSVIYTAHIRPLCLPSPQDVFDGQQCIASGWGMDVRTKLPAPIMKRIELIVVSRTRCQMLYQLAVANSSFQLHRSEMCAGAADLQNTCDKDGGTAMACPKGDGSYVLTGITSWGLSDCAKTKAPGVYVDVAKFAFWINNTIEGYEELHAEE